MLEQGTIDRHISYTPCVERGAHAAGFGHPATTIIDRTRVLADEASRQHEKEVWAPSLQSWPPPASVTWMPPPHPPLLAAIREN